jgi:hypothetical protein
MSKTIRKTTVDPRIDYDSLTKPYYHLIKEIKQIEKDKNINLNKFSEYLSQNFKASKKAGFEFISINTSGLDWKIENFDKIFPKK